MASKSLGPLNTTALVSHFTINVSVTFFAAVPVMTAFSSASSVSARIIPLLKDFEGFCIVCMGHCPETPGDPVPEPRLECPCVDPQPHVSSRVPLHFEKPVLQALAEPSSTHPDFLKQYVLEHIQKREYIYNIQMDKNLNLE